MAKKKTVESIITKDLLPNYIKLVSELRIINKRLQDTEISKLLIVHIGNISKGIEEM